MKALLIDDDPAFCSQFAGRLKNLYPDLEVTACAQVGDLPVEEYDLMFLDIDLGENGCGIDLSRDIPESCGLFYVTAYNDRYVQEIFHSHRVPDGYLIKPVDESILKKTVSCYLDRKKKELLELNIHSTPVRIPLHQILYLESENHYVQVILENHTLTIRIKMSELMPQLSDHFVRCHQSYIVNMEKVQSQSGSFFHMCNGVDIPMSRNRKKRALETWMAWLVHHE